MCSYIYIVESTVQLGCTNIGLLDSTVDLGCTNTGRQLMLARGLPHSPDE